MKVIALCLSYIFYNSSGSLVVKSVQWGIELITSSLGSLGISPLWNLRESILINSLAGGCKWHLIVFPKGNKVDYLSLYLEVANYGSLPFGWRRHAQFRLSIVNQNSELLSNLRVTQHWFDQSVPVWGFKSMFPFTKLHENNGGFMMNGEVKIVAEVDVLQVVGKSYVPNETDDEFQTPKKFKTNDDGANYNDFLNKTQERIDVSGFQVLSSQVESVRRIFKRHLDFASKFRPKERIMKSTYIDVILGLIGALFQLPQELSDADLNEASTAVSYVANGGFKVEWLEKKLNEVKDRRKKVGAGKVRVQLMKQTLQKLNQKGLDLKSLLEKEKANVSAANVALSFDDFV